MFSIGDKVVYPLHGAGVITDILEMDIFGDDELFYQMEIASEKMEITVPVAKAKEFGIRPINSRESLNKGLASMEDEMDKMDKDWNRRYEKNMDILRSGNFYKVASVVRNLTQLDKTKPLSSGERQMLKQSKRFLASEIVLACDKTKEEALETIEKRLV
ncbi:MAG: CarD family transcriptional regulator [Eubacteriaceae bacterium]|jgi:CarD family transcriptional regulator|nr:CarD family transcriptional regulator [Eubacteriaceae bacterium]